MIENKNNLVKELDFELDSLEEIIKNIENENRVIENRKNKKYGLDAGTADAKLGVHSV